MASDNSIVFSNNGIDTSFDKVQVTIYQIVFSIDIVVGSNFFDIGLAVFTVLMGSGNDSG